jgi:hypothetical protein
MEYRKRRNQPFRLIRHDDGGTVSGFELGVLQCPRERQSQFFEVGISETRFLFVAIALD